MSFEVCGQRQFVFRDQLRPLVRLRIRIHRVHTLYDLYGDICYPEGLLRGQRGLPRAKNLAKRSRSRFLAC